MSGPDAVSLTRSLLEFDTVNPPGRERDCALYAGSLLQEWGYKVDYHEYEDARTSVIARAGGSNAKPPLCLTGEEADIIVEKTAAAVSSVFATV